MIDNEEIRKENLNLRSELFKIKQEFHNKENSLNKIILELRQEMIKLQEELNNKIKEEKQKEIEINNAKNMIKELETKYNEFYTKIPSYRQNSFLQSVLFRIYQSVF